LIGLVVGLLALVPGVGLTQITKPADAPQPLSPLESLASFRVPPGFRPELVAAEPLIREPSGVCWDAAGDLFVCELHGYNLEGQYDIEELNLGGELDRVVRRLQADDKHKRAAEAETYGTIRRLIDSDGDGRIDSSVVWADRLPPCLGICAVRGGIIAACQTEILFLADRNGDGRADFRETLFEGFQKGPLERSINSPTWGQDGWIYFGRGVGGGTIRGPYLGGRGQGGRGLGGRGQGGRGQGGRGQGGSADGGRERGGRGPGEPADGEFSGGAVELPGTDFRIRPDGTAIEPILGGTATMGFAFTETEDRFTISTRNPGIFIAPIEWRYLARNAAVIVPSLQQDALADPRVYPSSHPHPWRSRRADDPGFSKFYSDRYGIEESAPNGYFTSACSPLVYQDIALPGIRGHLFACEPAQNLIHRSVVRRDGARLTLERTASEAASEFFTSTDPWFHAISLAHAPDGSLYIVDFYREIIEDYSAIPRYLQQLYGLADGQNHGRIWRLTHDEKLATPPADLSQKSTAELAEEVASPHHWRRMTANRLLIERGDLAAAAPMVRIVSEASEPFAVIGALRTLDAIGELTPAPVAAALTHADPGVRRLAIRLAERWLDAADEPATGASGEPSGETEPAGANVAQDVARIRELFFRVPGGLSDDPEPMVRLQLALSLGESASPAALVALAHLGRAHGDEPWMSAAILTALPERAGEWMAEWLRPGGRGIGERGAAMLEPLGQTVGNRRESGELATTLMLLNELPEDRDRARFLSGLRGSLRNPIDGQLPLQVRAAVVGWAQSPDDRLREEALPLIRLLKLETEEQRRVRLAGARQRIGDVQLSVEERLAALSGLTDESDPETSRTLIAALATSTPPLRDAIVAELVGNLHRRKWLLAAIDESTIPRSTLSAVQWQSIIGASDRELSDLASRLYQAVGDFDESLYHQFVVGLALPRDPAAGRQVFVRVCGNCHHAHGIGQRVGPDLTAEFRRSEETILRDVMAPSETISAGYATYTVATDGVAYTGVLIAETPTSLTLREAGGKEVTILRKDIEQFRAMPVSMMPEDLIRTLTPQDFADLLAWLRTPPTEIVLVDEDPRFAAALTEGEGTARFVRGDAMRGELCLEVTPPQRYAARIDGWEFPIREHPGPGEFRYLRFAWKSDAATGVMIELADDGGWPAADQPLRRYHAGGNTTSWRSLEIDPEPPRQWTVVTRDLWQDFGDFTLTGIAPTAMGAAIRVDAIELRQSPGD